MGDDMVNVVSSVVCCEEETCHPSSLVLIQRVTMFMEATERYGEPNPLSKSDCNLRTQGLQYEHSDALFRAGLLRDESQKPAIIGV